MEAPRLVTACRICGNTKLTPILSLGNLCVSDFVDEGQEAKVAPLELILCSGRDGGCGLLQLKHTVSGEHLYRNYWYRSGVNKTMTEELADIANKVEAMVDLHPGDYVMDIGANDGTLLRSFKKPGLKLTGFEPAKNLISYNQEGTTKVIPDFFSLKAWKEIFGDTKAKTIAAIAMFYDLDDPNSFVLDVKKSLHDEGVFVIQMMYLPSFLARNAFDGICHEHLEYYSLMALENLLKRHDLEVFDVEMREHINEGSFRAYVRHKGRGLSLKTPKGSQERVAKMRLEEKELGLDNREVYDNFAKRVEDIKEKVAGFVNNEVAAGKKIYVYGASTKGNTLLQYFGLNNKVILAAAERNPDKWGKKTVGTNIPIISEEQARKDKPDYFLVLPWHFMPEFRAREAEYLSLGGKFIAPLPKFEIIDKPYQKKRAIITGVNGQDGSYLAELLLGKGYEIHGLERRVAYENSDDRYSRIKHILKDKNFHLHYGDVSDHATIWHLINEVKPDEFYHLAGQSQVLVSFKDEVGTFRTNLISTQSILSTLRAISPATKFYFAATSEMFGRVLETPQTEKTPFNPVSPYAISKLASFYLTKMYRDAYGLFAVNGILFNHESPRRGSEFVTRKITSGIAKIKKGEADKLEIGNLDSYRDWGHAADYVEAMWMMLQSEKPDDYVIATGETHSVREFVEAAFRAAETPIRWEGKGLDEKGIDLKTGKVVVEINPEFFRPTEVNQLKGDYSKAKTVLGWKPKITFTSLVEQMVKADLA